MNMPDHMGSLGYKPMKKRGKWDPGPRDRKRRVKFCKKHEDKDAWAWKSFLQGVGDFSEFTWYPKELHPAFERLQSDWTYMTEAESKLPAFQRPNKKKKWFPSIPREAIATPYIPAKPQETNILTAIAR